MSVRRAAAHLPSRSVHLRIVPRPANLSESREIFRVLQRFGELNTYKHLRHEHHNPADNVALAIYRTPEAAQQALNASPLRFALERELSTTDPSSYAADPEDDPASLPPATGSNDVSDLTRPSTLLTRAPSTPPPMPSTPPPMPSTPPPMPSTPPSPSSSSPSSSSSSPSSPSTPAPMPFSAPPPKPTTTKWFQVTLDRSRAVHQDFVERQPLWKQFTPMKSMAQEDLAKVVPHAGLSDVSKRPPHAHRTPNKVLRSMGKYVDGGMPSLRALWDESQAKKEPVGPRP